MGGGGFRAGDESEVKAALKAGTQGAVSPSWGGGALDERAGSYRPVVLDRFCAMNPNK